MTGQLQLPPEFVRMRASPANCAFWICSWHCHKLLSRGLGANRKKIPGYVQRHPHCAQDRERLSPDFWMTSRLMTRGPSVVVCMIDRHNLRRKKYWMRSSATRTKSGIKLNELSAQLISEAGQKVANCGQTDKGVLLLQAKLLDRSRRWGGKKWNSKQTSIFIQALLWNRTIQHIKWSLTNLRTGLKDCSDRWQPLSLDFV